MRAENINEESADKKWETLSNDVKDLKSRNGKPEKEVITVRHGVNNWKEKVNTMTEQILTNINKDFDKQSQHIS